MVRHRGVTVGRGGHAGGVTPDQLPWEELLAAAPIPVSVVDVHGRQLAASDSYAEFLGYEPRELRELDLGTVTRLDDQPWTRTYLRRMVSGEIDEYVTDKIYVRKDGTEVLGRLTARPIRDADGSCSMLIGAITPIEEVRPPPDARLSRLLEFTGDHLTVLDTDGNVIESTGSHTQILGYPTAYWTDRNVKELVTPEDIERLREFRVAVLDSPSEEIATEVEVLGADGAVRTLLVRAVNRLDDPDIGGIVLATRDVTVHRERVAELSRRSATAESVVDAQTRLLATVSHELRNPLHAVRGLAELLAAEELEPRADELATSLVRQLSGLAQVTQDLLDAARLDAGKITIEQTPTDIHALVTDVVQLGRAAAGERSLDVTGRVAHDVSPWVMADGNRLRQVLGNLIGNAVKFTEDGSVQLVARAGPDVTIVFSVIDTGVGIPPEDQSKVLEPFTVASNSGEQRGAGLGLSIVQRLVAAMGGRVTLTSTPGEGTRFDVTLPLAPTEPPASADRGAMPTGLTILVVEDNAVNQQLATNQLERLGQVAVIAGSGEDGLAMVSAADGDRFAIVLMDHQLPGISGLETTQRIRALDGPVAQIPVIGLSASASAADREAFVAAGMDDFLPKPASLDDLSGAITRAMRGETGRDRDGGSSGGAGEPLGEPVSGDRSVDRGTIDRLVGELGGRGIVTGLIDTFIDELDGRIEAISAAPDRRAAQRAAHALKSSARLLGADALADACRAIEQGEDGDVDLVAVAGSVRAELAEWCSSGVPG